MCTFALLSMYDNMVKTRKEKFLKSDEHIFRAQCPSHQQLFLHTRNQARFIFKYSSHTCTYVHINKTFHLMSYACVCISYMAIVKKLIRSLYMFEFYVQNKKHAPACFCPFSSTSLLLMNIYLFSCSLLKFPSIWQGITLIKMDMIYFSQLYTLHKKILYKSNLSHSQHQQQSESLFVCNHFSF